jgi:hypothetical protein
MEFRISKQHEEVYYLDELQMKKQFLEINIIEMQKDLDRINRLIDQGTIECNKK